jgi:hypothetical protein
MRVGFRLAEQARYQGKVEEGAEEGGIACGQSAGMIDSVKPAGQIVQDEMAEAARTPMTRFEPPWQTARARRSPLRG